MLLFRDAKVKEMTVHKMEEMEKKLNEADKNRGQTDRDIKTVGVEPWELKLINKSHLQFLTAELDKQKLYIDSSMDSVRKMQESEGEKLRLRLVEVNDSMNEIDSSIAEIKSNITADLQKIMQEADSKEKVLDAKIDDQGDKLRLGMLTLQSAIGEGRGGDGGEDDDGDVIPLDEVEKMQEEAMEGLRETFAKQISELEQDVTELKTNIKQQGDVSLSPQSCISQSKYFQIIEARLRSHAKEGEDASNIMGDKLHQKMDSIAFTQERMKRQIEDLQERVSGAPTDISDLRDRVEDIERAAAKSGSNGAQPSQDDLDAMRRDLNKILGRDEIGTAEIDGIPTLTKLQTDVDQLNSNVTTLNDGVEEMKTQLSEKLVEEKDAREEETGALKKDLERLEKRSKELREKVKGKLGVAMPDDLDEDEEEKNE